MLHKITNPIITHSKIVLLLVGLFTLFAAIGLTKLEVKSDLTRDIPEEDALMVSDEKVQKHFNNTNNIWIGIKSENVFQKTTLDQVKSITENLKSLEWVIDDEVKSLTTINNIKGVAGGIEVGAYLKTIPETEKEFQQLATAIQQDNLLNGQLVSEDGQFTVIGVNLKDNYDSRGVFAALQQIKAAQPDPNNIYLAGTLVQLEELDIGINRDLKTLVPFALLLILLGYYFTCLLYTSPSPRDATLSRMPSSA